MRVPFPLARVRSIAFVSCLSLSLQLAPFPASAQAPQAPDFDRQSRQQSETDRIWRTASQGFMSFEKITYRSRAGDLDIPAFVFQLLKSNGAHRHPALVWVHEDIR